MNRLEELTLKLVDGEITDDEARELVELTRSTGGRESFFRLMEVESYLLSAGRKSAADRLVGTLQLQRSQRIEDNVMSAVLVGDVDEINEPSEHEKNGFTTNRSYRGLLTFSAVALLAMIVAFAVWPRSEGQPSPILAELISSELSVVVSDESSNVVQPSAGGNQSIPLRSGQSVETSRSMDSAEIVYADGTRIELLGNTKVTLSLAKNDAKHLTVVSGMVQADVARQPVSRPLQIVTSTATLEVLGTSLGVEVDDESTQLEVSSGLVAITRNVDDQRVDVSGGHFVKATDSTKDAFEAAPFPVIPSSWKADFESGVPAGWLGKAVQTESGFGVQAATTNEGQKANFAITTQNAWQLGEHALFQLHDDSVLHIRFQQSEFARLTVMLGTRVFPPEKGLSGANLFYTKKDWSEGLSAGHWKTISIPLDDVGWHIRERVKHGGAPDLNGLAAYLVHVSTMQRDTGLVVDRMWVTRGSQEQMQ